MGRGIIAGYQQVITKKVTLGITPFLHFGIEIPIITGTYMLMLKENSFHFRLRHRISY